MAIYLDHAAAAPVDSDVLEQFVATTRAHYANASATGHLHGDAARALVERARERVADLVGAEPARVIFTSGTTEANHLALRGTRPRSVVTSAVEHPSVQANVDALATDGVPVTRVACRADGVVTAEAVVAQVGAATDLVAIMHGNNETGAVNDIAAIATGTRSRSAALLHVDAAQTARWLPIDMQATGIDTVALSSHKIGGVKGIGALVLSARAWQRLEPVVRGGGQESGLRPGTLNVPAIDAFGFACVKARRLRDSACAATEAQRQRLLTRLQTALPQLLVYGPATRDLRLPHIVALRFPGLPASLVQAEVRDDVSIATGSACATDKIDASPVFLAMGLPPREALEVVRLSLGPELEGADIDAAADALIAAVRRLALGVAAC